MGELLIMAPWLPEGYHKDEEIRRTSFESGWFRTGDIVRIADDNGIEILDTLKDIIKSGGEWIPTSIVESVISEVGSIWSVAVVGKEDAKWRERPVAIIKASEKIEKELVLMNLRKSVQEGRINRWWIPDDIIFLDEIPLTSVGKMDKKVLKEMYCRLSGIKG